MEAFRFSNGPGAIRLSAFLGAALERSVTYRVFEGDRPRGEVTVAHPIESEPGWVDLGHWEIMSRELTVLPSGSPSPVHAVAAVPMPRNTK